MYRNDLKCTYISIKSLPGNEQQYYLGGVGIFLLYCSFFFFQHFLQWALIAFYNQSQK